jgi:hypothetical protein
MVMEEGCEFLHLIIGQFESGHSLIGASDVDESSEAFAVLIVKDDERAEKIRTGFAAFGVAAMTKGAIRGVDFLAGVERFLRVGFVVTASAAKLSGGGCRFGWNGGNGLSTQLQGKTGRENQYKLDWQQTWDQKDNSLQGRP